MPTTIAQYDAALERVERAANTLELMKALNTENVDEETFKTDLLINLGPIPFYKETEDKVSGEIAKKGGALEYIKEIYLDEDLTVEKYVGEEIGNMRIFYNNPDLTPDEAKEKFEDYIRGMVVSKEINFSLPMIPINTMYEIWQSDELLNHGKKSLFVSRPDLIKPNDESKPSAPINPMSCSVDQFKEKLAFARTENPEGVSVLAVGQGGHWTLLAVDHKSKSYRFIDSKNGQMLPELRSLVNSEMADYKEFIPETLAAISAIEVGIKSIVNRIFLVKNRIQELKTKQKDVLSEEDKHKYGLLERKMRLTPDDLVQKKILDDEMLQSLPPGERVEFVSLRDELKELKGQRDAKKAEKGELRNQIAQQHDGSSCGFWVLKNAQSIAKGGLEAELVICPTSNDEKEVISDMRMKAYKAIFTKILHRMKANEHAPALLPGIVGRSRSADISATLRAADADSAIGNVHPADSPSSPVVVGEKRTH